jgi:inhibitor of cysteine peptidase
VKPSALFITAVVVSFISRGLAAPPATITEADANRKIALSVGQELILRLESNRSTGYSWFLAGSDHPILTNLGRPAYKVGGKLPGAGGVETWTLRATKSGSEILKFEYRRPWEKKAAPAKTLLFHVTVQ